MHVEGSCGGCCFRGEVKQMRQLADFIADILATPARLGFHRYLIVDAAATRPTNIAQALRLGHVATDILTGVDCVWKESASPILVELPADASQESVCRIAKETLRKWRYANCFVFLETTRAPHEAAAMLRERTEAVLPDDMDVVLRFFDPRVFAALVEHLNADARVAFLSGAALWAIPDRRGEVQVIEQGTSDVSAPFISPMRLNSEEEIALIDAGEADAMVDLLLNQNNDQLLAMIPPDQHENVVVVLAQARSFGIEDVPDQAAFCAAVLALGVDFHAREPWVRLLCEVTAGHMKFSEAARLAAGVSA